MDRTRKVARWLAAPALAALVRSDAAGRRGSGCRARRRRLRRHRCLRRRTETLGRGGERFLRNPPVGHAAVSIPAQRRTSPRRSCCTEYCHESVTKGPVAGLPSVKTCMICHESIATDRPLIKQIADYVQARHRHLVAARLRVHAARRTFASTTRRTSAPRSSARPATARSRSRPSPSGTSN